MKIKNDNADLDTVHHRVHTLRENGQPWFDLRLLVKLDPDAEFYDDDLAEVHALEAALIRMLIDAVDNLDRELDNTAQENLIITAPRGIIQ